MPRRYPAEVRRQVIELEFGGGPAYYAALGGILAMADAGRIELDASTLDMNADIWPGRADARVITPDIRASNGIVHAINRVLIPPSLRWQATALPGPRFRGPGRAHQLPASAPA